MKLNAKREEQFFEILRKTGNVTAGAEKTGLKRSQLYHKRKSNEKFRVRWEEAMNEALDHLESQLWSKALGQNERADMKDNKKTSADEKAEERLAIFLLKAHRPEIFGDVKSRHKAGDAEKIGSPREKLLKKLAAMRK